MATFNAEGFVHVSTYSNPNWLAGLLYATHLEQAINVLSQTLSGHASC